MNKSVLAASTVSVALGLSGGCATAPDSDANIANEAGEMVFLPEGEIQPAAETAVLFGNNWSYKVVPEGNDLIVSWTSWPPSRQIRVHTSRNYAPYSDLNITSPNTIRVRPNQWLSMKRNGRYGLMQGTQNWK